MQAPPREAPGEARSPAPPRPGAEGGSPHRSWLPGAQPRLHRQRILAAPGAHHPTVVQFALHRTADVQLRIADAITFFAGSMTFVYLHVVAFATWMLLAERSPWPTLTLVVSLEAIFLSTFVMIGQNRQAAFQQSKADHEFQTEEQELHENTELTREIHRLTLELHAIQVQLAGRAGASPAAPATAGRHSHHAADPPPPGNPST